MNLVNMQKKSLLEYSAVIFDLDGTLYYQKPFRIRMALYLAGYALTHPACIRDLFLIKKYREVRENWEELEKRFPDEGSRASEEDLDSRQYEYVAVLKKVSAERVRKAVSFFMLEAPLKLLPKYRDEAVFALMNKLHDRGVQVVVYSDYPVKDKLNALGMKADRCFTSADESIGCMKPDPKGIKVILETMGLMPEEAVMIGDRYEKDGLAAIGNRMDYIILPSSPRERKEIMGCLERNYANE